ncbi:DUF427 domain-containing protein [Paenibacillus agri]|uniref:DUF427 domain-containing protein n=1 Tax=Paenibacillus agri TaxID=2744309 RepID=A0A850ELQ3_9BACL|nr:DUF427 domain-containing protein [Paenibacillus agri]NUU59061.1 DUF427 domain-containing protein [Paenibacillus agri]
MTPFDQKTANTIKRVPFVITDEERGLLPRFANRPPAAALPQESSGLTRRYPPYPERYTFEPSERWVRAVVGDVAVVDSRSQILVWEPRHKVPEYGFPVEHVRTDLLTPSEGVPEPGVFYRPRTTDVKWFDLHLGERHIPFAAWAWNEPGLEGYLGVNWFLGVLDGWYEEDQPVMTHPRDPHNRVDALPSSRHVAVKVNGRVIAETNDPVLVYETGLPTRYYFPIEAVDFSALTETEDWSECPYKGYSDRYWRSSEGEDLIAWSYSDPRPELSVIAGRIAFYNERVELLVDGESVN